MKTYEPESTHVPDGTSTQRIDNLLKRESAIASEALLSKLDEIKLSLAGRTSGLTKVVSDHPWRTVGAAGLVGFCLGALLTDKRQRAAMRETLAKYQSETPSVQTAPWWTSLVGPALDASKVLIEQFVLQAAGPSAPRSERADPVPSGVVESAGVSSGERVA